MDSNPKTKIYEIVRKLKIVPNKPRQEFLCLLVEGMIKSRSVVFSELADKIGKPIKTSSIERRIQDFFKKVSFNYEGLAKFFLSFCHHGKLCLSVDRTEWDFGKTQVNILCVAVSVGKMGLPLYFEMLDNNSGNSGHADRTELLKKLIGVIGAESIGMLVMDREFVGWKWLTWLRQSNIPFCVRVPSNHKITLPDGSRKTARQLLGNDRKVFMEDVFVDNVRVGLSLSYGSDGELLYLIGTAKPSELRAWYRRRWPIEVIFQALKGRGFNIRKSCLRSIAKYRKLFAVVCMAYAICWATGIEDGRKNPVRRKKHGYPQYSVFRRGLNLMRQFYKNQIIDPIQRTFDKAEAKLELIS